ncbi:MAG TPA: hypothetical protein VMC79_06265, partial [Rectinemataceae bacterium]|nr:hypothetical protein [Rectinemataceae bacterium]
EPAHPDSLRIVYSGFTISISGSSPARLIAADGSGTALTITGLQRTKSGVSIQLDAGVRLLCSAGQQDDSFSLSSSGLAQGNTLELGYQLSGAATLQVSEAGQTTLATGTGSYALSLSGVSFKPDQQLMDISAQAGNPSSLTFARIVPVSVAAHPQGGTAGQSSAPTPKDPAAFAAEIAAWRDKAWNGLSDARLTPDSVTWKSADGTPGFSERALDAYLAESLARGSFASAFVRVKSARELYADKLSYASAPYLGGLALRMPALETADLAEVKRLAQQVSDRSPDLFTKEGLIHFLIDRAPVSLTQDALRYAATVDATKLSVRDSVGLLGCVLESRALLKDDENPFLGLGGASERITAAVQKSADGLFLATEDDGSTDLRLSLLAGSYLVAYGTAQGKDALTGTGQGLVEGVLGLSDAQGFLPARILVKGGRADQKTGALAPEDLYPLIAANPYYPHEVSLYRDIAPGAWAWTCSPDLTVTQSPGHEVFNVRFPVGASHYLVLYGIKPFTNIQLYDIDYSPDSAFETYDASGYLYHRPSMALYLKMKHKKEVEDVRLAY